MIFLGTYKAGATVKYRGNFHNDTGTLENPTAPEAQREDPAGTFTALTAPAIINAKTGHYGGSVDTTGFASGQHFIRMAGTVATAKTVATEFCFQIVAYDPANATTLGLANLDAAVSSRMATYTQPTGFLAATFPTTVASTTNITGGTITTTTNLTNAPTNGDLTATMKASVTAAVPTAAAIGTDAASKVLVTPANKLATDASGYVTAGAVAPDAIGDAQLASDVDAYQAKVWVFDDNAGTNDRYAAVWHKNGQPITSGITVPTIQVIKAADGLDLVASTAMTQIAATGLYKHDEATNRMVNGAAYIVKVQATIDGSTRTWYQPVGRDSSV